MRVIIAVISDLMHLELPVGLAHKKLKALIQGVRLAMARLSAVAGEVDLFGNCFTVSMLVEKLKQQFCKVGAIIKQSNQMEHIMTVLKHAQS